MQFEDEVGPSFTALSVPYADALTQPPVEPTTLFGGHVPAVQFAPVTPLHFGQIAPLHGPEFHPVYVAGPAHSHTQFATLHAIVGHGIDVRG